MGSKILSDIQNDLKLLITSLTGFEETDEGYQLCERYVFSNMRHHRFLSINSHAVKRTITEVEQKFRIYGNYNVAREFKTLVETFLTSFDFEQHPQYDLQWSLLCLLLNLSRDTTKSTIECLHMTKVDKTLQSSASEEVDEIDWSEHLQEGQENFFCKYASSSESDWSDDEEEKLPKPLKTPDKPPKPNFESSVPPVEPLNSLQDPKSSSVFNSAIESRNWLDSNIENTWWNRIDNHETTISSNFSHAHLCKIYNREIINNSKSVGIITEYQACREIFWMFQVPIEMIVFQKKSENSFYVKENLSISSLTPESFNSAFSSFCRYFEMINRINIFEKSIQNIYEGGRLPPLTLEVYNASIKEYYRDIKRRIIELEQRVMKQNNINTFLTLSEELKVHLKRLNTLDEVHRSVVPPENEVINWKKSYKLLLSIYKEMENSSSRERTNLCASLYLSSLRVYLNIIDTWLSEGRLEDFRHEFLISKVEREKTGVGENEENESSPWIIKFVMIENEETETPDPIMKKLFRKVRDMGRSIELLVTLDRISDMWRINSEQFEARIPLCEEFTKRVLQELEKFRSADEVDDASEVNMITGSDSDVVSEQRYTELEDNIRQQVLRINNPFLMKVFQKYLPPINVDVVDCKSQETATGFMQSHWGIRVFERLEKISPFVLPFRKVLEGVLEEILDRRYSCAAKLVKDILIDEYKLEKHLKLMRSVFMMERGHVMKNFYQMMFSDVEKNVSVSNPESLTHLLEEVLSDEWRDSSSHNRWSISLRDACTRQVLQAVDHLVLNYEVDWPINMVLTKEALKKYNGIFRFGLKLKWALWALNNLRFADLEGKNSVNMNDMLHHFHTRRLESLRFWLLHAIGSIHSYLCGQVLQSLGLILEQELARADSLDVIIEAHNDYLEKVHEHCLQTPQFSDIMVTINNLLGMCVHVRDRWDRGAKQLISSELDLMESSFTKYHTYLALALHNAVQHKDADFLAGLTSAFN